jgi:hypothetical protein
MHPHDNAVLPQAILNTTTKASTTQAQVRLLVYRTLDVVHLALVRVPRFPRLHPHHHAQTTTMRASRGRNHLAIL